MAAAAATYRIGPSDFFTPGDLKADADTLNGQVEDLDNQIEGNESVDSTEVEQWVAFQGRWGAFYTSNFGGFFSSLLTSLNDANRDQLIQYEKDFGNFAAAFAPSGVALAGGLVQPSTGSKDTIGDQLKQQTENAPDILPSGNKIIIILVLVVVALFIFKEG